MLLVTGRIIRCCGKMIHLSIGRNINILYESGDFSHKMTSDL